MNKLIAIILSLLLTACAKPVYIASGCPKIELSPEPVYPTASLRKGDPESSVIKAMVMTIKMQRHWINEAKIRSDNK
jgi:hypothetical protein